MASCGPREDDGAVANATQLRIEYRPAVDGPNMRAPDDQVTNTLTTRTLTHFIARDSGVSALAARIGQLVQTVTGKRRESALHRAVRD